MAPLYPKIIYNLAKMNLHLNLQDRRFKTIVMPKNKNIKKYLKLFEKIKFMYTQNKLKKTRLGMAMVRVGITHTCPIFASGKGG